MTRLADDDNAFANVIEHTRLRILHALDIFPFISASMLHQAIGTSTSTELWRPVLEDLVEEGRVLEQVVQARTPKGRTQSYTIYHLPKYVYEGNAECQ